MCVPAAPHKCVHRWSRAVCELLIDARQRLVRGFMRRYIKGCLRARPAAADLSKLSKIQHFGAAHVDMFEYTSSATVFATSDNGLLLAQRQVSNVRCDSFWFGIGGSRHL